MIEGNRRRRYRSPSHSPTPCWSRSRSRSREREFMGREPDERRSRGRNRGRSFSQSRSHSRSTSRSWRGRGRSRSRSHPRSERHGPDRHDRWVHDRFRELEEENPHQRGYDGERTGRDRHDGAGGSWRSGRSGANMRYHRDSYYNEPYGARYFADRDSPRQGRRLHRYSDDEYDDEWERSRYRGRSPYRRGRREEPCSVIYLKGIPVDKDEADLYKVLEGLPGPPKIESVRIMRDRITGQSRGFAFADFASVEDARRVMEGNSGALDIDGHRLHMEYSSAPPPSKASNASAHLDWVCNMCGAVNFARRLECYQCCAPRAKDAQRVSSEPDGPSCILKVSGLEPQTSEDALHQLFVAHVPVKEIRMVLDKFTSAPRGFAFVHFHTVADASRMLNTFQGHVIKGQQLPLKVCFARDRLGGPSGNAANAAVAAVEAAQAMQHYSSWEPKEFDKDAAQVEKSTDHSQVNGGASLQDNGGYQYDQESGYYYHSATGFYYDANTGLFYDNNKQQWLIYDQDKEDYVPYADCGSCKTKESDRKGSAAEQTIRPAGAPAQNMAGTAKTIVQPIKNNSARAEFKGDRRRVATIGAKPQLNPEGLLAAAKAEHEQKLMRDAALKQPLGQRPTSRQKKKKQASNIVPTNLPHAGSVTAALSRITKGQKPGEDPVPAVPPSTVDPAKRVQGVIRGGKWSSGAG